MAKIDKVKEDIGFVKILFVTVVTMDVSLFAWLFKNYTSNSIFINIITLILIVLFSIVLLRISKSIKIKINNLEEL
jgi:Na+-transporting NADH:ubiquinone oxidoreductase subunit NqrD